MILLDTCVLLWLPLGAHKLPEGVVAAIRRTPQGQRWVCPLSAYEIGAKVARGRLELPLGVEDWFWTLCRGRGLTPLPVTAEACLRASRLPDIHRDPVDRILVAQAQQHGLLLLTSDETIARYPGVDVLWQ
ncbi:MAG: type II toxin-antitoxin system VapC family toxin [Deltaproteobacteria bacterium]|nr:type II toxin-antitoxin system VapC family toxin [Deltaproteobacteria bacterium]